MSLIPPPGAVTISGEFNVPERINWVIELRHIQTDTDEMQQITYYNVLGELYRIVNGQRVWLQLIQITIGTTDDPPSPTLYSIYMACCDQLYLTPDTTYAATLDNTTVFDLPEYE